MVAGIVDTVGVAALPRVADDTDTVNGSDVAVVEVSIVAAVPVIWLADMECVACIFVSSYAMCKSTS